MNCFSILYCASVCYVGTGPGTVVDSRLNHPSSIRKSGQATISDQEFVYQFRLILLGDVSVGKSSILRQFKEGIYSPQIRTTIVLDFNEKLIEVRGCWIKLQLWDTVGGEQFRSITCSYYRDAVGGLLVFDITRRKSFTNLSEWLEDAQRYAGPYKPVFTLVGNKTDLPKQREVSKEEALSFATQHDMEYYETSAVNGSNSEEVFHKLVDKILTLVDGGLIKLEEGWRGVKRGPAHHNHQGCSEHITLRGHSDRNQGRHSDRDQVRQRRRFC